MRERYVVDTNVLIAASAADPLTQKDWDATPKEVSYQRQVHQWLTAFEASTASWVLDGQGKIEEEYRRRLRHPDYALLVLQYKWDTQAVHYVAVEYDSDGHGWLDEPLQSLVHDRADRKMVAAALAACQDHEPCAIAFAGDTDWHDWEEKLDGANLGLSLGTEGIRAQNRGSYLERPFAGQFARLADWLALHEDALGALLHPPMIEIPKDLRSRRVEVVFLDLEECEDSCVVLNADWPVGLFERTAGAWQGELLREPQGECEQRQELE